MLIQGAVLISSGCIMLLGLLFIFIYCKRLNNRYNNSYRNSNELIYGGLNIIERYHVNNHYPQHSPPSYKENNNYSQDSPPPYKENNSS